MTVTLCVRFLSTPSARRATMMFLPVVWSCKNFYPRPPRGGRPPTTLSSELKKLFLSTPSARRATSDRTPPASSWRFLSTPSARRATSELVEKMQAVRISIHALREEGDLASRICSSIATVFLSTPSARRATCSGQKTSSPIRYFYPRPPRGGRRGSLTMLDSLSNFYPRPPRGGRQKPTKI